jgi:ABC-type branched-subunit amino acid transport system substrate-binding protein
MNMKFRHSVLVLLLLFAVVGCAQPPVEEAPTEEEMTEEPTAEEEMTEEPTAEEEMTEEPTEEPMMEEVTLTIGFTVSQTGSLNVESTRQANALQMWIDDVNGAGGIHVGNTVVTFDTVFYDDESASERVQELYTRLATEDGADFLISPYSSGLTESAAVIAEQYGKIMITTGAARDSTYQQGYTHVFQTYTPASRYLAGALDQLQAIAPDLTDIAFVYENSSFSTSVVEAARAYAETLGYNIVVYEGYDPETADFSPFINKIEAAQPQAILGGGHFQDGATFARQLHEGGVDIQYLALLVAPPEPTFAELGDAALGVVGPSQWEPQAEFTPEAADAAGLDWIGPLGADFVDAYQAQFGEEPSYHAAGGYAAGLILQHAIEQAGSIDPDAVLAALDATDMLTFYGHIKFDTSPENHGLQIGHSMVYIQWQEVDGELVKEVVWPPEGATADVLFPLP